MTLDYGKYGTFLIMGNAGCILSTVCRGFRVSYLGVSRFKMFILFGVVLGFRALGWCWAL